MPESEFRPLCFLFAMLAALLLFATPPRAIGAQEDASPQGSRKSSSENEKGKRPEKKASPAASRDTQALKVTRHVLEAEGKSYAYVAKAGEMVVELEDGKTGGNVFYVSYELEEASDAPRPVTFAFNGGPGASAVWLHMGALGPRRVALGPHGEPPLPPAGYEDNPFSWLRFSDLVFVDPVGTGFSRGLEDEKKGDKQDGKVWGVEQDVKHMAAFIRIFLSRNERWDSPTFLVGESYGTVRAAALSHELLESVGLAVNGLILISPVLDFNTLYAGESNLPFALFLPSYAATALHYGKLSSPQASEGDVSGLLREVEDFVEREYLRALFMGDALSEEERKELYERVAGYTGLPVDVVGENFGRVPPNVFFKRLLQERRLLVGRMDGTVSGVDPDPGSPFAAFDPSLEGLLPSFASAFNTYVRKELDYESDLTYELLNSDVERGWDWSSGVKGRQGYVNVAGEVREAMSVNPAMRVWLAGGYYDLATPYFAGVYTVRQMELAPSLRQNLRMDFYEGGHMLYTHREAREKFFRDAAAFYAAATQ